MMTRTAVRTGDERPLNRPVFGLRLYIEGKEQKREIIAIIMNRSDKHLA